MPEQVTAVLQYGALGLLALVIIGGGKTILTALINGLERLLDQQKDSNMQLAAKLNGIDDKLDETRASLHTHMSESERRLDATITGRRVTPPPSKTY